MSVKRWIWLATLLALLMGASGARAQADGEVEIEVVAGDYAPGGQTSFNLFLRNRSTTDVLNGATFSMAFFPNTNISSVSWAVAETSTSPLATVTSSPTNGTGAVSVTADFAQATGPAVSQAPFVRVRLEVRWSILAAGDVTLQLEHDNPALDDPGPHFVEIQTGDAVAGPATLCSNAGEDGVLNVPAGDNVVNTYFPAPADDTLRPVNEGERCLPISINDVIGPDLNDPGRLDDIKAGDLLMIVQMQGVSINATNTAAYGDGVNSGDDSQNNFGGQTNPRQAGLYEFVIAEGAINTRGGAFPDCSVLPDPAAATVANPLLLPISGQGTGGGLLNAYERRIGTSVTSQPVRATYQIIRVPQYLRVLFAGGSTASILAAPWNGRVGGVVALDVQEQIDFGSGGGTRAIHADQRGFRGGMGRTITGRLSGATAADFRLNYQGSGADAHGIKGEGTAGTPELMFDGAGSTTANAHFYPAHTGTLSGSLARGGPGNAGGGGNHCVPTIPPSRPAGGAGGSNAGFSGNGGHCSGESSNARGGQRVPSVASLGKVFMGGGGGAGARHGGSGNEASGGVGGGIVVLRANRFLGTGRISADAGDGVDGNTAAGISGGGGGGGGGSVVLQGDIGGASEFAGLPIRAVAGKGGDAARAAATIVENYTGPGGGGGGGVLSTSYLGIQLASTTVLEGSAGVTTVGGVDYGNNPGNRGTRNFDQDSFSLIPGAKPGWMCSNNTLPVTLSFVDAKTDGSQLRVAFETASEAGTLGFRIHQGGPGGARGVISSELVDGRGESSEPRRYETVMPYRGATELWIEEVDVKGKSSSYGPFPIGSPSGEQNIAVETNWTAIQAEQTAFRQAEALTLTQGRNSTELAVELRTRARGWYSLSFEQLQALGVDWSGVDSKRLQLSRGTRVIPLETSGAVWQAGSTVRFYGERVDNSIYTDDAVYRLQLVAGEGERMRPVYANAAGLQSESTYLHTLEHAPNRLYSFLSPTDPWHATRLVRSSSNPGNYSETVTVSDRVPATTARLTVDFWGGTDFPDVSPDHSVRVLVNGTPVGHARFDGFDIHTLTVDLPATALQEGANTVGFQMVADNGQTSDLAYLERIRIDYVRQLKLEANGSLAFGATQAAPGASDGDRIFAGDFSNEGTPACSGMTPGCGAYAVQVGASSNARAFRIRDGLAQPLSAVVSNGVLRFAALARPGDQFRVETAGASPALRVAAPAADLFGGLAQVDYLAISHPSFSAGLQPLLAAREAEGLRTHVVNVEDLYRAYTGGEFGPAAIEAFLREAKQRWSTLRYVVFVGGDTYDYKNHSGLNSIGFVPTLYRATSEFVRWAPVDMLYADTNGDGVKELAIGRLPVRSNAELANLVAKTLAYPTAGHGRRVHWVADRDSGSYPFARVSASYLPLFTNWQRTATDLNAFPQSGGAAQARAALITAVNAGQAVLAYYGHSSPTTWTQEGMLTGTLLAGGLFNNASRPTAIVQLGCYGAYFVNPRYNSISHGFLLDSSGAAAVVAASGLTGVVSDELYASKALPPLSSGQRIGDVVRDTANSIRSTNPDLLDVIIGTAVLGDPALRINVQPQ